MRCVSWLLASAFAPLLAGCLTLRAQSAPPATPRLELVLQAPPTTSVSSVTVSPDGSLVATASGEGGVRLYDAKSGELLRAIGSAGDRSVVFSPDGKQFAAGGFHMDKLVGVYDVGTGDRVKALAGQPVWEANGTAFSPDGQLLASATRDDQVLVWELATGTLRHRLGGPSFPVVALAFSPDGETLAAGGQRGIRLWDPASGSLRRTLEGHRDWVTTLAFSPDGRTLASGSCDWAFHRGRNVAEFSMPDPGCVSEWKLWEATSGELKRTVSEPGRLLSVAFSPDGQRLAAAIGRNVRLYPLGAEGPGRTVTTYDFDATSVAFTPDGRSLVSGSHDQLVRRVALATGRVEWEAPGSWEQVNGVALSPDGSLLAAGSSDRRFAVRTLKHGSPALRPGAARLWDARTGRLLRRFGAPSEQVMAVAFSADGHRVVSGGAGARGAGVVHVADPATGKSVWTVQDHAQEVVAVAFSPDGSRLATAGAEGEVRLRDPDTGTVVRTLAGHEGGATSLAFSRDGSMLVCGDGRGAARLWDARTGQLLRKCQAGSSRAATVTTDRLVSTVAFSPDGQSFLACPSTFGNTYGEPARLWDARTGELLHEFEGGRPVALSPDGSFLAAGGKTVELYDVKSGRLLRRLIGFLKKTQSLAFSADGRRLFAGGSYGTVNAWEVAAGRHLVTLFTFPQSGKGKVTGDWLAYHPDGFYHGSPGVERYLGWELGGDFRTPAELARQLHRPERVAAALQLMPSPDPPR